MKFLSRAVFGKLKSPRSALKQIRTPGISAPGVRRAAQVAGCRVSDAALRPSISAQADGIDGALLRGTIATSSSRASRRRCYHLHRRRRRLESERARRNHSTLAGGRSLAAPPTNGVVAVPLNARRRRRRLRARPRRHGRTGRHTLTAVEGSREAACRAWCCLVAGRVLESFATAAGPLAAGAKARYPLSQWSERAAAVREREFTVTDRFCSSAITETEHAVKRERERGDLLVYGDSSRRG